MTTRKYSSRSQQTTLALPITSSDTSMQVVSGSALIPGITVSASETYTIVIDPDTALEEIVDVKSYTSGNVLTITRAIDGSTAVAHAAGAVVRHMATGRDFREANTHIESGLGSALGTTVHGVNFNNIIKNSDTGTVTSTMILDGTILNADINASAAIAKTKISGTAITAADTATVTNAMLAGSIAETKHQLVTVGTGSLSGSSTSVSVPATYRRLFVFVQGWSHNSSGFSNTLGVRINNDTGTNYFANSSIGSATALAVTGAFGNGFSSYVSFTIELADQTTIPKMIGAAPTSVGGFYTGTSAVSSIQFVLSSGSFDAGTYAVYGQ